MSKRNLVWLVAIVVAVVVGAAVGGVWLAVILGLVTLASSEVVERVRRRRRRAGTGATGTPLRDALASRRRQDR